MSKELPQVENRMVYRYIFEANVPEVLTGKDRVELHVVYKDADGNVRRSVEVEAKIPLAKPSIAPSELPEVQAIGVPFEALDPVDVKVMGDHERIVTEKVRKAFEGKSVKTIVDPKRVQPPKVVEVEEFPTIRRERDPEKFDDVA